MISDPIDPAESRRGFLRGGAAVLGLAAAPFLDINAAFAQRGAGPVGPVDLGAGDVGILNYAFALEQLEAAFYSTVVARPYAGINGYEARVMRDLRDHEVAHREFLRRALGANRISDLAVDFSAIDFRSRSSVLQTAQTFEDLGVSAYNGAGQYLQSPANLFQAGRIVSVEARHAAIIRDIISPLSPAFAGDDVVNSLGLDVSNSPSTVLRAAQPYIATPITASRLG